VEGRTEDVLVMTAPGGTAPIHPNVFHDVLDSVAVSGWQVRQDSASALTVLLAGSAGGLSLEQLAAQIAAAVQASGATRPSVTAQVVTAIPRTALGKAPLVLAARSAPAPPG
jgi:hypothetical protein